MFFRLLYLITVGSSATPGSSLTGMGALFLVVRMTGAV
jgi:hypothetical protein